MVYRSGKKSGHRTNKTLKHGENKFERVNGQKVKQIIDDAQTKIFKEHCEKWEIPESAKIGKNEHGEKCYIIYDDEQTYEKIDKRERKRHFKAERPVRGEEIPQVEQEFRETVENSHLERELDQKFSKQKCQKVNVNDNHKLREIKQLDMDSIPKEELRKHFLIKDKKGRSKYYLKSSKQQTTYQKGSKASRKKEI